MSERGRGLIATLPTNRLLTATDGPFTQCDGRSARPADVESTIGYLANLYCSTPEIMATAVEGNLRTLLSETDLPCNDVEVPQ
jgi:TatD DNase family protein